MLDIAECWSQRRHVDIVVTHELFISLPTVILFYLYKKMILFIQWNISQLKDDFKIDMGLRSKDLLFIVLYLYM